MVKTEPTKRKVIPRISKQNILYKPVKKNMNRFVKEVSGPLSKAEICIGHALSNTYGFSLYGVSDEKVAASMPVSLSLILDYLRWYVGNPSNELFYFQTEYVRGHSTIICMKKSIHNTKQ